MPEGSVERLIVVDASLSTRIPSELRKRGRDARSLAQLGLKTLLDPDLIPRLAARFTGDDWMLLTGDDAMPLAHGEIIAACELTVATVHPWQDYKHRGFPSQEAYKHEVVHRWAHKLIEQKPQAIRRYTPFRHSVWTPRH